MIDGSELLIIQGAMASFALNVKLEKELFYLDKLNMLP